MEFLRVPCVFGRTYLWYFSFYIVFFWCLPSSPQLRSCDGISFTVSAWPLGRLEVLLLAVYHTVISLQNLTTNEHVPSLSGSTLSEKLICKNQFIFVCGKIGSWSWHIWHAQTNMSNMSNMSRGQELLQGRTESIRLWWAGYSNTRCFGISSPKGRRI